MDARILFVCLNILTTGLVLSKAVLTQIGSEESETNQKEGEETERVKGENKDEDHIREFYDEEKQDKFVVEVKEKTEYEDEEIGENENVVEQTDKVAEKVTANIPNTTNTTTTTTITTTTSATTTSATTTATATATVEETDEVAEKVRANIPTTTNTTPTTTITTTTIIGSLIGFVIGVAVALIGIVISRKLRNATGTGQEKDAVSEKKPLMQSAANTQHQRLPRQFIPPSGNDRATYIHKEIFKEIEKYIVFLGKDGPCLLTVVNRSRFDSDLETAKQDAYLTDAEKAHLILIRIVPVGSAQVKKEREEPGEGFCHDFPFLVDFNMTMVYECEHNDTQYRDLIKYLQKHN